MLKDNEIREALARTKNKDSFKTEEAWNKFSVNNDIKPKGNLKRIILRVAASLLIPVSIAIFYFNSEIESYKSIIIAHYSDTELIDAGRKRATLYISDGRKFVIGSKVEMSITEIDGTGISNTSKSFLVYDPKGEKQGRNEYNKIIVPKGSDYKLTLADGSVVMLNSGSELRFPVSFNGDKREVFLSGEAYFDIAHNKLKPFLVKTFYNTNIKVLGTKFNVTAYKDSPTTATTLVEGSVKISNYKTGKVLKPGYQAVVSESRPEISSRKVNTRIYTAWTNDRFVFDESRLDQILYRFSKWYGCEFVFLDKQLKNYKLTCDVKRYSKVETLLNAIDKIDEIKFIKKGNTIYLKSK